MTKGSIQFTLAPKYLSDVLKMSTGGRAIFVLMCPRMTFFSAQLPGEKNTREQLALHAQVLDNLSCKQPLKHLCYLLS